jgi:hypothetical protein
MVVEMNLNPEHKREYANQFNFLRSVVGYVKVEANENEKYVSSRCWSCVLREDYPYFDILLLCFDKLENLGYQYRPNSGTVQWMQRDVLHTLTWGRKRVEEGTEVLILYSEDEEPSEEESELFHL